MSRPGPRASPPGTSEAGSGGQWQRTLDLIISDKVIRMSLRASDPGPGPNPGGQLPQSHGGTVRRRSP
eukprot:59672-Hanusia_phi.AAC.1